MLGDEIKFKLYTAEKIVIELINKFVDIITDPRLQEGKYDWMDPVRAVKPVASTSKVNQEDLGK